MKKNEYSLSLLVVTLVMISVSGCRSIAPLSYKFDADLQEQLEEMEETGQERPLDCFVEVAGAPDALMLDELEEAGLELVNITNAILSVRGFPDALLRASEFEYVVAISLRRMENP